MSENKDKQPVKKAPELTEEQKAALRKEATNKAAGRETVRK